MHTTVGTDLVEQQIKRWQLAQVESPHVFSPCVALSRLPGTPAAELGQLVAERLNYGFFGIEIVDEIARTEGVSRELVRQLDEHVRNGLDRWLLDTFRDQPITDRDYMLDLGRAISAFGEKGEAVVLGRGAVFLLHPHQAFKVQIIASEDTRAARLGQARQLGADEARKLLAREEQDRLDFLRQFAGDPDDPLGFDMTVNTDQRDLNFWADVIADAVKSLVKG